MKTVFALGAIVALTMISPAAAGPTACPINEAVSRLEAYYIRARGEIASKEKPLLNEQSAINDQAKNPNMPIGSQLRPDQLARFDEINRQMLALRAKDAALSGYVRDAGAIVKLANVALGVRRGFKYPDNSPDHFYSQYVLALAGLSDNQGGLDPTDVKDGECSIDSGLYVLQHVEVGQTDLSKVKATLERVMAIAKRYHIDPTNSKYIEGSGPDWIERIPVIADKQQVRRDVMAVQDGVAGVTYVQVMQDLRGLTPGRALAILGLHQRRRPPPGRCGSSEGVRADMVSPGGNRRFQAQVLRHDPPAGCGGNPERHHDGEPAAIERRQERTITHHRFRCSKGDKGPAPAG